MSKIVYKFALLIAFDIFAHCAGLGSIPLGLWAQGWRRIIDPSGIFYRGEWKKWKLKNHLECGISKVRECERLNRSTDVQTRTLSSYDEQFYWVCILASLTWMVIKVRKKVQRRWILPRYLQRVPRSRYIFGGGRSTGIFLLAQSLWEEVHDGRSWECWSIPRLYLCRISQQTLATHEVHRSQILPGPSPPDWERQKKLRNTQENIYFQVG